MAHSALSGAACGGSFGGRHGLGSHGERYPRPFWLGRWSPNNADFYENFDSCALGNTPCSTSSGIQVSFLPDAQVVNGSSSGLYAALFLSGNNGMDFGNQPDGQDQTNYLTSGSDGSMPGAGVTLQFAQQEKYLGLLWGSVDAYNTLTFYNGATLVGQFTGADVANVTAPGNCTGGNQGMIGTCYVNINFFNESFDRVVATSSQYAFEFDNVAFSKNAIGVPEPGTAGMFLLGLLLLGSGYWYQKRRLA